MVKSNVGNIKSGWRSVFMIFTAAADDELEPIVESAFENVEQGDDMLIFSFCCNIYVLTQKIIHQTNVHTEADLVYGPVGLFYKNQNKVMTC